MERDSKSVSKATRSVKALWHTPTLRRLPIAATASGQNKGHMGNEGTGGGKGDAATTS